MLTCSPRAEIGRVGPPGRRGCHGAFLDGDAKRLPHYTGTCVDSISAYERFHARTYSCRVATDRPLCQMVGMPSSTIVALLVFGVWGSLLLSWQLRFGALSYDQAPAADVQPTPRAGDCADDPGWSAYGNGVYTCSWLTKYDPGCVTNACVGNTDFGQCHRCGSPRARCAAREAATALSTRGIPSPA